MDKKIISLCFLLIIVIAVTVTYIVLNQPSPEENPQHISADAVTPEELSDEIDDYLDDLIDEDDEIKIGAMV